MTEAQITSELKTYLEAHVSGIWIKHADRSTLGIPDCSFTHGGRTLWIEIKLISLKPSQIGVSATEIVDASTHGRLQLQTMRRLAYHGHSIYVIFCRRATKWYTLAVHPERLYEVYIDVAFSKSLPTFLLDVGDEGKRFEKIERIIKEMKAV